MPDIHQVECSGEPLTPDVDLLTMVLYRLTDNKELGYALVKDRKCSTTDTYVACHIDSGDPRRTKLVALVYDLPAGESRAYGCNMSVNVVKWQVQTLSWSIVLHQAGEYPLAHVTSLSRN